MAPVGVAILGSGIFAKQAHIPAIAALHDGYAELKAIYSRSEKSASELAAEAQNALKSGTQPAIYFDDKPDGNLDALLARDDISAVVLVLPITTQPTIIRKALSAGKHVLSEKPVAADVASGLQLIDEYNTQYKPKGLIWRVAENFEVEPGYHAAAKAIRDGKIGKVGFWNARVVGHTAKDNKYYNTPWRTVPDYQGGFLLDGGVHTIAALRVILGNDFVSLSGYASLNQSHLAPQDTINAVVQSADGSHGLVELTFGAPVPSRSALANPGITVTGSDGWVSIVNVTNEGTGFLRVTVRSATKDEQGRVTGEAEEVIEEPTKGVKLEWESFIKAIEDEDDGLGTPLGALKDVAFIQAGLNSNGQPVDLVKLVQS